MAILATLVPADRRALTTVDRLKAEVGDLGRTDDVLEILIARASAQIEGWCGRVLARETVREALDLAAAGTIGLSRTPVVSIASLTLDGTAVAAADYETLDGGAGLVRLLPTSSVWGGGYYGADWFGSVATSGGGGGAYGYRRSIRRQLVVEYVGGFVTPGWSDGTAPDLPADIEGAAILLCVAMTERARQTTDVVNERLGDYAVAYASGARSGAGELPGEVQALLRPWTRVAL